MSKKITLTVSDEAMLRIEKAYLRVYGVSAVEKETPLGTIKRGLLTQIKGTVSICEEEEAREKLQDLDI